MPAQEDRRVGRRLGLIAAGLVAAVLIVYLGAVVILRSLLDPTTLADRLEPHLSAALNRRVSVAAAEVSVFPRPEFRLLRIRVENLPDFEGLPLATVDELGLRPRLLPLFKKRVEIDRVQVLGPRILFQVDEAGRTNFGDFVPESRELSDRPAGPISLELRDVEVREGRLGYRDAVSGRAVQLDGLRVAGSVSRNADGFVALDLRSDADSLRFALPPAWKRGMRGLAFEGAVRATADPKADWIVLDSGSLDVGGLRLDVTGRIDSLSAGRRWLDLKLGGMNVDVSRLVEALPDSVRDLLEVELWGEMDADITIRGPAGPGERPDVEGLVTVRNAGFRKTDRPLFEDARFEISIGDGRASAPAFRASVPGGEISGSGAITFDSTFAYSARIDATADLPALMEAAGSSAGGGPSARTGRIRVDASFTGTLPRPAATRATGQVDLSDLQIAGGRLVAPVTVPRAVLSLEGTSARWSGTEVRLDGGSITTSGSLSDLFGRLAEGGPRVPRVDATFTSRHLDLDALLGRPPEDIGYGRIAWARLGGSSISGRAPEELARERRLQRPVKLPVRGRVTFRVDSLVRRPYQVTNVQGLLLLEPDHVEISDTRFGIYGGTGTAQGDLQLGSRVAEPFRLDLSLQNVRAEEYLSQNSPIGRMVSGGLTMDVSLAGEVDSLALPLTRALQGAGRFEIRDGRVASNPLTRGILDFLGLGRDLDLEFSRWNSPFTIRDGAIVLGGSYFAGSSLIANLQGALGFGGSLDLGAIVSPDSTLARGAITRGAGGEVLRRYMDAGGVLEIALLLTGRASDPDIELDPSSMERSTRNVLERAAGEAVRSGETEVRQRGLDLLRGLTGQDGAADTARVPAADTAGARTATESPGGP